MLYPSVILEGGRIIRFNLHFKLMNSTYMKRIAGISLSTIGLLGFAFVTNAAMIDLNTSVKTDVNAVGVSASTAVNANTQTTAGATSSEVNTTTGELNVLINTPQNVTTSAELETYVDEVESSDDSVGDVEVEADRVSVEYKQKGKLFGFIPSTVSAEVIVNADGTVDVSYPWYSFLVSLDKADTEESIKAQLETTIPAIIAQNNGLSSNASVTADFSTQAQAQILNTLRYVINAQAQADAEASAEVK